MTANQQANKPPLPNSLLREMGQSDNPTQEPWTYVSESRRPKQFRKYVYKSFKPNVEDGLFNPGSACTLYRREKAWHRLAAELAASGHTVVEIAAVTGKTRGAVGEALAQPFAMERIVRKTAMNATDEIREILEKQAPQSLQKILKIADDPETPQAVKYACHKDVLDRFLGKAAQPFRTENPDPSKLTNAELAKEVEKIVQNEKLASVASDAPESPEERDRAEQQVIDDEKDGTR